MFTDACGSDINNDNLFNVVKQIHIVLTQHMVTRIYRFAWQLSSVVKPADIRINLSKVTIGVILRTQLDDLAITLKTIRI